MMIVILLINITSILDILIEIQIVLVFFLSLFQ